MTLIEPHITVVRPKRWTKAQYYDLVDRGAFRKQRVFLNRGELIEMASMGALHAAGITNITEWLVNTFCPEYRVRIQLPIEIPG